MTLQTAPETSTVDTDELSYLLSRHLLKEMQTKDTSAEVTRVNVDIAADISSAHSQSRNLQVAFGHIPSKDHAFAISGEAYFAGSLTEDLVSMIQESFEGDSEDEFVRSLQNAEDAGLQSTKSILVHISSETVIVEERGKMIENRLGSINGTPEGDPIVSNKLYVLAIVFSVGFALVAMYVFKTRRGRINREETNVVEELQCDEEADTIPELPRYIEVENENEDEHENDETEAGMDTPAAATAPTATLQSDSAWMSVFGSIRDALTLHDPSVNSPEELPPSTEADAVGGDACAGGEYTQTKPPLENLVIPGKERTKSDIPSNVEVFSSQRSQYSSKRKSSKKSQSSSSRKYSQASQSSTPQKSQVSNTTQSADNVSIFPDLPSISETSHKLQVKSSGWDLCGAYAEPDLNSNEQSKSEENQTSKDRPSFIEEENELSCVCSDDAEAIPADDAEDIPSSRSRLAGGYCGQKFSDDDLSDTQSMQTSRVSNTSKAS